ncbi:MAG: DoxX family protein [Planctomycetes bacterium]|nr:DoxX family protein [Planctomycetota bacterium]
MPQTDRTASGARATQSVAAARAAFVARLVAAGILGQTLFFKFSGAPEAVFIFTTLGVEPWGRLALGVVELLTAIALLVPATRAAGALVAVGLMLGAIASHLGPLGIEVQGDGGTLFTLAVVTLLCAGFAAFVHRRELPLLGRMLG